MKAFFLPFALLLGAALPAFGQTPATPFAVPLVLGDGWETADPAQAGFDATRIREAIKGLADGGLDIHSVLVERHGRLVAEVYRRGKDRGVYSLFAHTTDFGPTTLHDTRSVGKSVVSLLLGIARAQGKLGAITTPAVDFYPEYPDLATPQLKAITLEHLLTMSSGFKWSEGGPGHDDEHSLYWKWSPCYYALSRPIATAPGTVFNYNSGGNAVLSDILVRVTGMPLKDFARKNLFEPLGITDWEWTSDLHGRPMSFTGLRMRPRDMAKIGRLVLAHGQWEGRQIVPAGWIEASLQPRISTGFDGMSYGYQWWTGAVAWQGRTLPWAAAFGNGSQRVFVVPDLDMAVVVTAGAYGDLQVARRVNAFIQDVVSTVQK
ncbi:MAG: serine hydrolase [Acidobacteria bacterium]|nr:serine hydrolase [Acidobacteriota bacterium]